MNQEIEGRLRIDLRRIGDFAGVHALPASGLDVPDERATRLGGLLVKSDAAVEQLSREDAASAARPEPMEGEGGPSGYVHPEGAPIPPPEPPVLRTFYGSVDIDPARVGRDAGRIAEEVIQHLSTLRGAKVSVTLEIKAEAPDGIPDAVRRTVAENSRTLKFKSSGFEDE